MHLEELQSCPSASVVSGQRRPADTRAGGETRQKDGREGRHRKRLGKSGEKGLNGGKGRGEREVWSSWGWLTTPTPPSPTGSTSSTFLPLRQNHLPQPFSFFHPCFPLAPFHALFCRKTPPKFKTLGGKRGEGEQRAASCGTSPLPSPNRATPLPSGAGSQRPRLSQSTNRASPT